MLVEKPENCDAKKHRSRVRGSVRMCTRGKFCRYVYREVIYEDNLGNIFL